MTGAISVVRDDAHHRYTALVAGDEAGVAHYRVGNHKMIFYHTVVRPEYEGQGVGSALAKGALTDVRSRGEHVVLECSFMSAYVQRHPEFADLVSA